MEKLHALFQFGRGRFDDTCRRLSVGAGLLAFGGTAMAQDTIDVSDSLLKIAAGLAAAILVSVAMTGAIIAVRASKLPRRGA